MNYPPPSENPRCTCYPNMLAAFWCPTGHMTECHAPRTCEEAECGHLQQYAPEEEPEGEEP